MQKLSVLWLRVVSWCGLLFLFLACPMQMSAHVPPDEEVVVSRLRPNVTSSEAFDANAMPGLLKPHTPTADAENVEFVGHIGGSTEAVFVLGNYAYIGEGPRLTILDVSNLANPTVVGKTLPLPDTVKDLYVAGDYAYIANEFYGGLQVVDVSNPTAPTVVGSDETLNYAEGVAVSGDIAYVANCHGPRYLNSQRPE